MMRFQIAIVLFCSIFCLGFDITMDLVKHLTTNLAAIQWPLSLTRHTDDHISIQLDTLVFDRVLVEYFWNHLNTLINLCFLR